MPKLLEKCLSTGTVRAVCGCSECLEHYPVKGDGGINDNQAFLLASVYTSSIFTDLKQLRSHVQLSGHLILKRWRRRTPAKRKQLLKQVDPDLYPTDFPLMDLATQRVCTSVEEQSKYRYAYLAPYLNLECLSDDSANLIKLLHHRASSRPEDWVAFDDSVIKSAFDQKAIRVMFADGCITMSGPQFGAWKNVDLAEMNADQAYSAWRALLILDAQAHVLKFLGKFCEAILGHSERPSPSQGPSSDLTKTAAQSEIGDFILPDCGKWLQFISSGSQPSKGEPWVSYSSLYSSEPFGPPPEFDVDMMMEIAENQMSEAQDELWLMQTDCSYFHERARYHEAQFKEDFTKIRRLSQREKYGHISYLSTVGVLIRARDWQWLKEECRHMQHLLCELGTKIGKQKALSNSYAEALVSVRTLLTIHRRYCMEHLKTCMLTSEAFKSAFRLIGLSDPKAKGWSFEFTVDDYPTLHKRDRTAWCLYHLAGAEGDSRALPHAQTLQYLDEQLARSGKEESNRLDKEMDSAISDLAAVERISTILQYHRPNFLPPHMHADPATDQRMTERAWVNLHLKGRKVPAHITSTSLGLDMPLHPLEQFRMPKGGKDETWIAKRDRAHQALRTLWAKAREAYQTMLLAQNASQEHIDPQLEQMKQCESPEQLLQLEVEKSKILDRLNAAKVRASSGLLLPVPESFPSSSASSRPEKYTPQLVKDKPKTRPQDPTPVPPSPPVPVEAPPPVLYLLKPNSVVHRVVTHLFPDPHDDRNKGSLDWLDFVAAMAALGFRAENRGGSVFTFKGMIKLPETPLEARSRSINFHKPHPSTEMSAVILQGLGKRLRRRYGWEWENFGVEDGEE
ncbi:MAG: hypothetical protein LQ346_007672 [Caloplaca aetnensis]|nr:MAG: hypothetical protein LQ346_007672 [Caloplaca aetnensis]